MAKKDRKKQKAERGSPAKKNGGDLLDMKQAIRRLKTTRATFYRWLREGKVKGMKVGRQWRFYREDIERFLKGQEPRIDLPADISPLVEALRKRLGEVGGQEPEAGDSEVSRAVNLTIALGAALGASDIHLDPGDERCRLRYRVDGALYETAAYDSRLQPPLIERWKTMAACDPHERRVPQDGRIRLKLPPGNEQIDLRVAFLPAYLGEALTVRLLRRQAVQLEVDRLGFTPRDKERLLKWAEAPWGVLLVTGPTGCGKTTVLYSLLSHVNRPGLKVMSVEDPVEYVIEGLIQAQVRRDVGLDFARILRSFLRSDPDVIMVGEIRNLDTLQISFQAALTGHLVMSTLHTDEAVAGLKRMVDMGADPFLVADATKCIVAQRLVRKLCPDCAAEEAPDAGRLGEAERRARLGGLGWDDLPKAWRKPVGCQKCKFTGYRGRQVIAEVLEVTPETSAAIRRGASLDEMRTLAVGQGMTTMSAHGVLLASRGKTSLAEVFRVAPHPKP